MIKAALQGGFFLFIQGGLLVQIGEPQFPHNDLGRFQGAQTSEPDALLGVFLWAQGELAGENPAAKGIFAVGLFEPVVQLPGQLEAFHRLRVSGPRGSVRPKNRPRAIVPPLKAPHYALWRRCML